MRRIIVIIVLIFAAVGAAYYSGYLHGQPKDKLVSLKVSTVIQQQLSLLLALRTLFRLGNYMLIQDLR
jgi:hypothetical protein